MTLELSGEGLGEVCAPRLWKKPGFFPLVSPAGALVWCSQEMDLFPLFLWILWAGSGLGLGLDLRVFLWCKVGFVRPILNWSSGVQ